MNVTIPKTSGPIPSSPTLNRNEREDAAFLSEARLSNLVRLRTLVLVRWLAIIGQVSAIMVAIFGFHLQIDLSPVAVTIGASLVANFFSTMLFPETTRLSSNQAVTFLVFDTMQMGMLLYLAGGLNNPFSLLLLAPVTIGATVLSLGGTIALGIISILIVTLLRLLYVPLVTSNGTILQLPEMFLFGFWAALTIGIAFFGIYARRITAELQGMNDALLATQMALAREQKLTDLGGVVAAAAHELGTPLATIKLVAAELADELDEGDHRDDAELILHEANRCRDILHSMGRAGKEDKLLLRAPLEAVVYEAAEPHLARGREVLFRVDPKSDGPNNAQPTVLRRPEVVHGLRNFIQNAVDFSQEAVLVEIYWDAETLRVRVEDDGEGFPPSMIGRIGDPFVHRRKPSENAHKRPGYEGMGLGLFIAKTLLERSGAKLVFANDESGAEQRGQGGARITVTWPRSALEAPPLDEIDGFGENEAFAPWSLPPLPVHFERN